MADNTYQNAKVYHKQSAVIVADGGEIEVESGGNLKLQSGAFFQADDIQFTTAQLNAFFLEDPKYLLETNRPVIKVGLIADPHAGYGHADWSGQNDGEVNIYSDWLLKMQDFTNDMKRWKPDFCIQLGDFSKSNVSDESTYKNIFNYAKDEFEKTGLQTYHVIGNHDSETVNSKTWFKDITGYANTYYSFDVGNWHFVVLDPCYENLAGDYPSTGGNRYIPTTQLDWLTADLAANPNKKTLVFSHITAGRIGEEGSAGMQITNADDLRAILEADSVGRVIAMLAGHNHGPWGGNTKREFRKVSGFRRQIVSYYEMMTMVNGHHPHTAYSKIILLDDDNLADHAVNSDKWKLTGAGVDDLIIVGVGGQRTWIPNYDILKASDDATFAQDSIRIKGGISGIALDIDTYKDNAWIPLRVRIKGSKGFQMNLSKMFEIFAYGSESIRLQLWAESGKSCLKTYEGQFSFRHNITGNDVTVELYPSGTGKAVLRFNYGGNTTYAEIIFDGTDLIIDCTAGSGSENAVIKLKDSAGANKFQIKDSGGNVVFDIDSNGVLHDDGGVAGYSGTVANPSSITVKNGIVTAVS